VTGDLVIGTSSSGAGWSGQESRSAQEVAATVPFGRLAFPAKAVERSDQCDGPRGAVAIAHRHPMALLFERTTPRRLRFGAVSTSRSVPIFEFSDTRGFAGQSPLPDIVTGYPPWYFSLSVPGENSDWQFLTSYLLSPISFHQSPVTSPSAWDQIRKSRRPESQRRPERPVT
jgi:hypothetical protein